MIGVSVFLQQYLSGSFDQQARDILDSNIRDLKAYFHVEHNEGRRFRKSLEQSIRTILMKQPPKARLERVFLLADCQLAKLLDESPTYETVGTDSPQQRFER